MCELCSTSSSLYSALIVTSLVCFNTRVQIPVLMVLMASDQSGHKLPLITFKGSLIKVSPPRCFEYVHNNVQ